jgi:hypothetical protein
MTAITFDSLHLVRELRQAGVTQDHAEAIVDAIAKSQNGLVSTEHFDSRIATSENNTKVLIAEAKADIIKWNVGAIIAAVGLALTAVKILGH